MVDFLNDTFTRVQDDEEQGAVMSPVTSMPTPEVDFLNDTFTKVEPLADTPPAQQANLTKGVPSIEESLGLDKLDQEAYGVDTGAKLKKDDLRTPENLKKIRNYMVERSGYQYSLNGTMTDEELVDDFITHRRNFETNTLSTIGEVRYITKATDKQKEAAKEAYELYDQLGSVFTNDGFFGAVDGVKDYVFAAATDPSNYLGLLTAGAARAGAFGGSAAAKQFVKKAAAEAGMKAMKNGATRKAAAEAGEAAAQSAIAQFASEKIKGKAAKAAIEKLADVDRRVFMQQAKAEARQGVLAADAKKRGTKALAYTTAGDALIAMSQDYSIQSLMMDVGAQEEYSAVQTGFSSLFGAVGGGAQLIGGKFSGASGLGDTVGTLSGSTLRAKAQEEAAAVIAKAKPLLDDTGQSKANKVIKDTVVEWQKKWKAGRAASENVTTESDLLSMILLGPDGKGISGGLAKVYREQGHKLPKGIHTADVISNTVRYMPQKELDEINKLLAGTHTYLGEMVHTGGTLGNLIASEANRAGTTLSVFSQTKRAMDVSIVQAGDVLDAAVKGVAESERKAMERTRVKPFAYGQNIWRRMVVSSPQTTSANVSGFGMLYTASAVADILSGTLVTLAGLTKTGAKRAEYLRVGKVYRGMVAQKMRYLLDPFTTHDAYMKFLSENENVSKILFETVSSGVERSGKKFGMDPDNKWFKNAEVLADGVNRWTGVRVQDSFTKSQMFMSEMDKYLRINKKKTLEEVINSGEVGLIDDDIIGAAIDGTLKSVLAKDYTTDDQLLNGAAKLVEGLSSLPGLGTILPFGRFFNNVIGTSYQWTIGGAVPVMQAIAKSEKRNLSTLEAASRSIVGVTGLYLAYEYDKERSRKGLGITEVDVGGGQISDMQNVYPFSAFLVAGRALRLLAEEGSYSKEVKTALLKQVAIGQFAEDAQFGNDLNNILSMLSDDEDTRGVSIDAFLKTAGNFTAGFTRPLDAVNRAVGFINDSDVAKDVRQASGGKVFTQSATKYVDNIIEIFSKDLDAITGEELRVATRGGPLQDANPGARIAGVTIKPPKTATELAYAMADMLPYTANERSKNPAYDKAFTTMIQPMLEKEAEKLFAKDMFKKAAVPERQLLLRAALGRVKADIRKYVDSTSNPDLIIESLRKKALTKGSKAARKAASSMLEGKGVTGRIKDYGYKELQLYLEYVTAYDKFYKDM